MEMDPNTKVQTAFRLPLYLVEKLKEKAKADNRSLNSYVTVLLLEDMYREPNEETKEAIEEARRGERAGSLDMSSFESFMKSIDEATKE